MLLVCIYLGLCVKALLYSPPFYTSQASVNNSKGYIKKISEVVALLNLKKVDF